MCFSVFFVWLISSVIALWSENTLDMISTFLELLRLVLCLNMWSIPENVPCVLVKNAPSLVHFHLLWDEMLWRYQLNPFVTFKASASLMIFCTEDLPIEGLGYENRFLWQYFYQFLLVMSIMICFTYLGAPVLGALMFTRVILSFWIVPFNITQCLFVSGFKVYFIRYKHCYPNFLFLFICMNYFFPSLFF